MGSFEWSIGLNEGLYVSVFEARSPFFGFVNGSDTGGMGRLTNGGVAMSRFDGVGGGVGKRELSAKHAAFAGFRA
jgi:hypothetical protein